MSARRSLRLAVLAAVAVLALGACSDDGGGEGLGGETYSRSCASCHGQKGQGGIGKSLIGIADRYTPEEHRDIVVNGTDGDMPALGVSLSDEEIDAVVLHERETFK